MTARYTRKRYVSKVRCEESALTAEMGKTLKQMIDRVDSVSVDINEAIHKAYSTVKYTQGILNSSGEVVSGSGYVSAFLPVVGTETIVLNGSGITKVAYYDKSQVFGSIITPTGNTLEDYTVPAAAAFARFQVAYNGGSTNILGIRRKTFENKSFHDLIRSPIKTNISIGFTGDSNTVGYGLSSGDKSWANLLGDAIIDSFTADNDFGFDSPWVESVGYMAYSGATNFKANSEISIYTDAAQVKIMMAENYSSAWKWHIDGIESGTASSNTLDTDGQLHKITVRFTSGQAVNPYFRIQKTITCSNDALTGAGIANMPFNIGYDWYFVMIGTNMRATANFVHANYLPFKYAYNYYGKGTFVVPFPNHKSDSSYVYSQMKVYSQLAELFKEAGWDVINLATANAAPFFDDGMYQSDKIHYNATGHKIIANMVAGMLGLPLYLQA